MSSSKQTELTQAVIDKNANTLDRLLNATYVNQWISNRVHKDDLLNHGLGKSFKWTTAMCRACFFSDVATIRKLVDVGASLYDVNSYGDTALTVACHSDTDDVLEKVQILLKEDKQLIHATTNKGFSALHVASEKGHAAVCEYLIHSGALVNAENKYGFTPLHSAAKHNHIAVIAILHRHGANLRHRNNNHSEPLHAAALGGSACDALESLIAMGTDIHAPGFRNRSALHNAAQSGSVTCIKALLDRGVPVDVRDKYNATPLHLAAANDHVHCIHLLVSGYGGANINWQTTYGETPLHWACKKGKVSAVEALMAYANCDINIRNKDGKIANELAAASNHLHVASFFAQIEFQNEHCRSVMKVKAPTEY